MRTEVRMSAGRVTRRLRYMTAAGALALIALPGTAGATVVPPTVSSAFTPTSIGSGGTSALSITITNPNTSALSGIAFSDTLPAGVVVDNPNGASGTCGSTSVLTAAASSSTISLATGKLAASASCTVQVSVTSTTPGNYQNTTGPVTSTEATPSTADTQTLTVFGLPAVSVGTPKENAVYSFGQKILAEYSCSDAFGAPGLSACSGDADSGTAIDTTQEGANTFSVSAISNDGAITTQTVDYVVLPDNRFTVSKVAGHASGQVTFNAKLPNTGKLVAKLTHNGKSFGSATVKVKSDGTIGVTVKPNPAGAKLIKAGAKAKHPKAVALKLTVTFTPFLGKAGKAFSSTVKIKP